MTPLAGGIGVLRRRRRRKKNAEHKQISDYVHAKSFTSEIKIDEREYGI